MNTVTFGSDNGILLENIEPTSKSGIILHMWYMYAGGDKPTNLVDFGLKELLERQLMFEINNDVTRDKAIYLCHKRLCEVVVKDLGLHNFYILCDKSNNPPAVVDNNELVVDVYLSTINVPGSKIYQ